MAMHVRGVVLPDDEVRDLWLVGDRVTFEPVPGAETISDGGFVLPGLVDAHCHLGIARGGRADRVAGRRPGRWPAPTGTRACSPSATPARRTRIRELDDDPEMPRLARAGRHVAPPKRYLRDIGVEVRRRRRGRRRHRAGRPPATAGSSWSATGSTATSATSRPPGTPTP